MNKAIALLLLILLNTTELVAQQPTDSIQLSLLTCAPGEEAYSLFGHTAIRYKNPPKGIDLVFNYGMFSFNTPNFIFRFALGETDYQLGTTAYDRFVAEYSYFGRDVWQQTLNLTPSEKQKLVHLLEENYLPQNRDYRYNFLYDNCATRPRDKIEQSLDGKIMYTPAVASTGTVLSFRDIIHQYTKGHDWIRFGIDFGLGREADYPITDRQTMFAPFYLMNHFAGAQVVTNGTSRPLIADTEQAVIVSAPPVDDSFGISPLQASLLLFIATAAATIYGIRKKKSLWGIDIVLFTAAGIAGTLIAFLALFSQHPAVGNNYLLIAFHPGHLLFLPFFVYKASKGRKSIYHAANSIVLTLFILFFFLIPQQIDVAVLPLALCLLVRSASYAILTYKKLK